jgi:hypothetical protein
MQNTERMSVLPVYDVMTIPPLLQHVLDPWLLFLAGDPVLRALQGVLLLLGVIVIFTVFYATRDILLRTHSFPVMLLSIVLVAFLPIVGFFLYLLVRPARTISQRLTDSRTEEIYSAITKDARSKKPARMDTRSGGQEPKKSKDPRTKMLL